MNIMPPWDLVKFNVKIQGLVASASCVAERMTDERAEASVCSNVVTAD